MTGPSISVTMNRDLALWATGWIQAHQPPGEWEPSNLTRLLRCLNKAIEGDDDAKSV